jgi:polyvinyl alcohol dehydrogenase (cytochrome)
LTSSPTVYGGVVYMGADNGTFYALSESTGRVRWSHFIGYVSATTCGSLGFSATATVAPDPVTRALTVYVAAADGYLYALSGATGTTIWRSVIGVPSTSQNDYYNWSSPTVANSRIYVGISSQCDNPLVRGGLLEFDQSSGDQLASYYTVPPGDVGGSIWTSAAISPNGTVYVSTGNGPATDPGLGTSLSLVALNGQTLQQLGAWQVPMPQQPSDDSDFGGSPTLFSATLGSTRTSLVGACNKNGTYYVFRAANVSAGPVWQDSLGRGTGAYENCDSAAVWDRAHLYLSGPTTVVDGTTYGGSVEEVDPANGAVVWVTGLPEPVEGTPAVDGSGVLALATIGTKTPSSSFGGYLLDAATGAVLASLSNGDSPEFAQPVFADDYVFLASFAGGLTAYQATG